MINRILNQRLTVLILLAIIFAGGLVIMLMYDGTGDSGDSIMHYLFARYAWSHPENFLDSWAKPVFVLIASPFARLGFSGMKFFNLLLAIGTAYMLYSILKKSNNRFFWLPIVFLFAAPLYFTLIFSGLTEYLFAFLWIFGIGLFQQKRYLAGAVLLSFLPFARSEGLLLLPFAALFLMYKRQWLPMGLLVTGHLIYGLAGLFAGKEFLWMFTENAYAGFSNEYGSGPWNHFLVQLTYVIGVPLYFLLFLGLIMIPVKYFTGERQSAKRDSFTFTLILVVLPMIVFILAHSIFWSAGLYHSMGLKRVLICVVPLMIYVVTEGLDASFLLAKRWPRAITVPVFSLMILMVLLFPLTSGPAAIKLKELEPSPIQQQMKVFSVGLKKDFAPQRYDQVFCTQPCLLMELGLDPFDHAHVNKVGAYTRTGAQGTFLIIWDGEFSEREDGVKPEWLLNDPGLRLAASYPDRKDYYYLVFEKRSEGN